jgi:hypothetical protein
MTSNPKWAPPFDNPEYSRGFEEGQRHSSPSAETTRRLNDLSEAIKVIPDIYTRMVVLDERTKTILDKITDTNKDIEKLDTRVSAVEKEQGVILAKVGIFASAIATVGASVAGVIINRIL